MKEVELSMAQTVAFLEESLLERKAKFIKLLWVQGGRIFTISGPRQFNTVETIKTLGPDSTFIIKDEQFKEGI